ncbi:lectin subunit alpha-like [Calliphora vicina]|uniref:lectin subunit alpha-like n=1 Tax=Calliphora vicina TaxID=7373 RepID=UPI00325C0F69
MKTLAINLVLISFLIKIVSTVETADQNWYKSQNGNMYYIEESYKYSWYEAALQCSLKKLSLLTLETQEEHNEVAKILKENNFAFHAPHLWIGAVGGHRLFTWVSNSQPVFTDKWIPGNPDNWNQEEYCLHFWENTTELNDRKCDFKYGFICEENDYFNEEKEKNQGKYKSIVLNIVNKI